MPAATPPESPPAATPASPRAAVVTLAPVDPPARLSLDDFLSREPRLRNRPTLAGGFARHCVRRRLTQATLSDFTAALDAFEHGAA